MLKKGRYLLNTDGGMVKRSVGDKFGEAAIGVVLNEPGDRAFQIFRDRIGPEMIQGAEYKALIKGLELALEYGIGKIRVYVDNQLVVDQINALAAVKSDHLRPYHDRTLALLNKFSDQRVYWVPRERNKEADKLVREALAGIDQGPKAREHRPKCAGCGEPVELAYPDDPQSWIHAVDANYLGDHSAWLEKEMG